MLRFYLLAIIILAFCFPSFGKNTTFIWDYTELKELKQGESNEKSFIINEAKAILKLSPVTVVDKKNTISGDKHNYESLGCYFWPDPDNPNGPYIARDGKINPEYKEYDLPRLYYLNKYLEYTAKAYFLTENEQYYKFFCNQLDTWFINGSTRMNPNFEYCQFCPGKNGNKGNPSGNIDSWIFTNISDAIRLVNSVKSIGKPRWKAYVAWMKEFGQWMMESPNGKTASQFVNNQSIVYDTTLLNIYLLSGDKKKAKEMAQSCVKRIQQQIEEDGSQPEELKRTKAFEYSIYNLTHMLDFISLCNGAKLKTSASHAKIIKAFEYLSTFKDKASFPYTEIGDWSSLQKDFEQQKARTRILLAN